MSGVGELRLRLPMHATGQFRQHLRLLCHLLLQLFDFSQARLPAASSGGVLHSRRQHRLLLLLLHHYSKPCRRSAARLLLTRSPGCAPGHIPGTNTMCRPYGTRVQIGPYPGLPPWAKFVSPFGLAETARLSIAESSHVSSAGRSSRLACNASKACARYLRVFDGSMMSSTSRRPAAT